MADFGGALKGQSRAVAVDPPRLRRATGGAPPPPPVGPDDEGGDGGGGGPWLPARPPWYRRRGVALGSAIVVVIGIAVVTDLPQRTTLASDAAQEKTVLKSINTDLAQCAFAVREGFQILRSAESGSLSAANRGRIPALMRDDVQACSFTNSNTFDLANIEVPGTAAGRAIGRAVSTLSIWTTSDALGALTEIANLTAHPAPAIAAKERLRLRQFERYAAEDRAKVLSDIAAASRDVKRRLAPPAVPAMPNLT